VLTFAAGTLTAANAVEFGVRPEGFTSIRAGIITDHRITHHPSTNRYGEDVSVCRRGGD
jgi:hypothetical protein